MTVKSIIVTNADSQLKSTRFFSPVPFRLVYDNEFGCSLSLRKQWFVVGFIEYVSKFGVCYMLIHLDTYMFHNVVIMFWDNGIDVNNR